MQTDLLPIFYRPTKVGFWGFGVGWGINVHVHDHTSRTVTSHLVILEDTSAVRWGWVGVGYQHSCTCSASPTLTSHPVISEDTSGVPWGWVGLGYCINVHVHVHASLTETSHLQ